MGCTPRSPLRRRRWKKFPTGSSYSSRYQANGLLRRLGKIPAKLVGRHCRAEKITLHFITPFGAGYFTLYFCFYAFRSDRNIEGPTKAADRADDPKGVFVAVCTGSR